jgi:phospholipid N-methyltransferase
MPQPDEYTWRLMSVVCNNKEDYIAELGEATQKDTCKILSEFRNRKKCEFKDCPHLKIFYGN